MHNRGNGKGGGIGAVGFVPEALGVSRQVLDNDYMHGLIYHPVHKFTGKHMIMALEKQILI